MVAIAMLVGIQPVFAEQFVSQAITTPEGNTIYVASVPLDASFDSPASPIIPSVQDTKGHDYGNLYVYGAGGKWYSSFSKNFSSSNYVSVAITITSYSSSVVIGGFIGYKSGGGQIDFVDIMTTNSISRTVSGTSYVFQYYYNHPLYGDGPLNGVWVQLVSDSSFSGSYGISY